MGPKPSRIIDGSATDRLVTPKVGYGSGQAGVFTSGGTQSNLMGVLLARDACIAKTGKMKTVIRGLFSVMVFLQKQCVMSKSSVLKMHISLCRRTWQ